MATTLPRPSRPSLGPSLPVAKSRKNSLGSPTKSSNSRRDSAASSLPTPDRTVSSSGLPTPRSLSKTHSNSTTSVSTLATTNGGPTSLPAGKSLRKTISIGSFPQPPRGVGSRVTSHPPSPLSNTTTLLNGHGPSGEAKGIPPRGSSLAKTNGKKAGSRPSLRSPLSTTSPSLLNGSGDSKSVSLSSGTRLSLPSPPGSRNSSAQGSYATSATTFEDAGEDDAICRDSAPDTKANTDRHSTHKDGKGNVIVSVRVRPDAGGSDGKAEGEWMVDGRRSLISYKGREGGEYIYDNVFATHDNNSRVYDSAAKRLVRRVMEGYHGTVFAYGMTGTGKTFSMQGTATSPGVIPLAITDIFSFIRETPHREFLLRVSYLEIYNEKIHDLLSAPAGPGINGQPAQDEIKLREDSKRGVYATPLKEEIVQSPTQLLRVIARGDNARRVAGTQFNARSSRSHAVVQIVVESRERVPGSGSFQESKRSAIVPGGVRVSTLSLIDLAGSEKAAETKERRTEGAHINKSLLTLGTVIARLSGDDKGDKPGKDKPGKSADKEKHLPYRDSKLTRLLQPALSGNSLVSILCTIQIGSAGSAATANSHTGETLNTLKFASRAKNNIVSHAKKAEEALGNGGDAGSRALLDRYRMEIQELRKQLDGQNKAKQEQKEEPKDEELEKLREAEAEQRHQDQMLEMQLARTALKERIEHLNRLILSSKSFGVNTSRSFSSMSMANRASILSNSEFHIVSARSSASHPPNLEVPGLKRTSSAASGSLPGTSNGTIGETGSEEDDSVGENGDGTASQFSQIRALQADLADKNRYISTLEKRLLQARRSSHSRVSMTLAHKVGAGEEGGCEGLIKEKDAEIADLRARLDDKDRMVTALRSAARKRDVADLAIDTTPPPESRIQRRSEDSTTNLKATPLSPVALLAPSLEKRAKGVEEMTRILDEMISERVDGHAPKTLRRSSIRVAAEGR